MYNTATRGRDVQQTARDHICETIAVRMRIIAAISTSFTVIYKSVDRTFRTLRIMNYDLQLEFLSEKKKRTI